mmetsp:Transcript_3479/g.7064  ORF Transcript_3479/g.7064 Transcript_3479/m.7064 type:complete len:92 (-) Transcript_3479:53-328(-)
MLTMQRSNHTYQDMKGQSSSFAQHSRAISDHQKEAATTMSDRSHSCLETRYPLTEPPAAGIPPTNHFIGDFLSAHFSSPFSDVYTPIDNLK